MKKNEAKKARLRGGLLLPLVWMSVLGCSGGGGGGGTDDAWYRAKKVQGGWIIARADPEDDSCYVLALGTLGGPENRIEGISVNVAGVYATSLLDHGDARRCETVQDGVVLDTSSTYGQIRLEQTSIMDGTLNACRIDIDVTTPEVRFLVDDLYAWESGCEPEPSDTTYYANLEAAYIPETVTLTIAGWDPANEACGWINFNVLVDPTVPSTIDVPTHWYVDHAMVAIMSEDECDAASLGAEGSSSEWLAHGRENFSAGGALSFTDSQQSTIDGATVELPCKLDIDAWVGFFEPHYWAPVRAGFQAHGVTVVGACP